MNKTEFLTRFQLNEPVEYHEQSLMRLRGYSHNGMRRAAVMIGCVERGNGLNVILTKRASHLRHHPGQISFPGGKHEEFDTTLSDTALREVHEEIGIPGDKVTVIGQLPELMTVSRFLVTPVIALVDNDYQAEIDYNEVDYAFEVPASHLFDIQQLYSQVFEFKNYSHRVFAIPYKHHFIWGVTAQIIQALQLQLK